MPFIYSKPDCWHSYFDNPKPYRKELTKAEEELEKEYGQGYYDEGPDPFHFTPFESEDDYGDESWP